MNMKIMTAVDAKTRFGQFLDTAQRSPVIVTKKNRPVGVFFSIEDLENTSWGEKVQQAHNEGYLSVGESESQINSLLHEN